MFFGSSVFGADFSFYSDQYFYGGYNNYKKTDLDPNNEFLEVPTHFFEADIRPQIKVSSETWSVVVRPRLEFTDSNIIYDNPVENTWQADGKVDLTAAYAHFQIGNAIQLNGGLETYQWGGAEFLNPSNPFFHFSPYAKSFAYVQKGEVLLRLGIDWSDHFNTSFISQPISNNEPAWIAPDETESESGFVPKWAFKNELRNSAGDSYFGVVTGQGEEKNFFVGEYATFSFQNGFSFYVDAKHQRGRSNYVPEINALTNYDLEKAPEDTQWWTTAVGGIRYQGDFDYRLEFLYNQAGWSREEYLNAYSSLLTLQPTLLQNTDRFRRSGLELKTQQYLYASVRMPDLGEGKSTAIFLRDLFSFADQGQAIEFLVERNLNDSVVGYFEIDGLTGTADTESAAIFNYQILLGAKWTL
jgi:hypothetical protein